MKIQAGDRTPTTVSRIPPRPTPTRETIGGLVTTATGVRIRAEDLDALTAWTAARARALSLAGIDAFCAILTEHSDAGRREREQLIARFTTGETYFFRDPGQLDLIASTLLPELIERRAVEQTLRIWSAGCGGGEEAYSLAILLEEMAPRLVGWKVLILGTDINAESLEKARLGVYGDWSFRGFDSGRKARYFDPRGRLFQIHPRLRALVTFRQGDLVRDAFPDAGGELRDFDLILCRNVFIYFDERTISAVTAKFTRALGAGGYLVTGHNELFGHAIAPLKQRMFAQSAALQKTDGLDAGPDPDAESRASALADPSPPGEASLKNRSEAPRPKPDMRLPGRPPTPAEQCDQIMQTAWRLADLGLPGPEELCRQANSFAPLDPRPYYLMAQLAQERHDLVLSKSLLKKVIYLDPDFIAAYLELAGLFADSGENQTARRTYVTARRLLRNRPPESTISPHAESTAAETLAYLDRLLGPTEEGPSLVGDVAP